MNIKNIYSGKKVNVNPFTVSCLPAILLAIHEGLTPNSRAAEARDSNITPSLLIIFFLRVDVLEKFNLCSGVKLLLGFNDRVNLKLFSVPMCIQHLYSKVVSFFYHSILFLINFFQFSLNILFLFVLVRK